MTTNTPYRAIFCDLLTDHTIDILPLRDVTVDDYIGRAGSLSGTIPVANAEMAARVRRIEEGRTSVYLQRGKDLWWGGIIWTSTLQSDDKGILTLGIQAATFESYAGRRLIRAKTPEYDASYTLPFAGMDQLDIARGLWTDMQTSLDGGNILVTYGTETSGVTRTITYRDGDETSYQDALDSLAALEDGFEYHITVYTDPASGSRVRRLVLGHPKIETGATDLVLDRPGTVLSYSFPRDATRGGTTARARGASTNSDQASESRPLASTVAVADQLIGTGEGHAGYPRVDLTSDHNDTTDQNTLDALARTELAAATGAVVIPAISIRLDDLVPTALLGRTARIRITDEWFTEGLDARYRIIGVKVSPAQRGRPDTAELYLEEAA
ncbi:hypothetical protein [Streptomyces malaysiense]|uniref:Uncharacterized protein n=1 Tax=Streptomyces malaysiense TaxID=1428626 RepID=A0A1J4Q128_9ACTN|nr:hypothetical protein [Streptomyces malaysiense]OIK25863.1 hypothetical protein VT52_019260 [Streptomyces malaysiense]